MSNDSAARRGGARVDLPQLTAFELERHIPVSEAAAFLSVSEDTFERRFGHLIRKISPRRNAVKVRDLIAALNTHTEFGA
jgi:hypothetical protein